MFDDISYINDASNRITIYYKYGLYNFLNNLIQQPPHSPISTIIALLSLITFGFNDAGFYITNAFLLILVTIAITLIFRKAEILLYFWIISFILFSPFALGLIENFRPDIINGVLTTGMIWYGLDWIIIKQKKATTYAGVAFGLSLLAKPTFFAHTIALVLLLISLSIATDILRKRKVTSMTFDTALPLIKGMIFGFIIALPYFALNGISIFYYFWRNTQGVDSNIWSLSYDIPTYLVVKRFLFDGYQRLAGNQLWLAATLGFFGLISFLLNKNKEAMLRISGLFTFSLASFIILVIGRHNNEYFFSTFQTLIYLIGSYSLFELMQFQTRKRRIMIFIISSLGLVYCILSNKDNHSLYIGDENKKFVSQNVDIMKRIAEVINKKKTDSTGRQYTVFLTSIGLVSSATINWEATKAGIPIAAFDAQLSGDFQSFVELSHSADFVVVPYTIDAKYEKNIPSTKIQSEIVQFLLEDKFFSRPLGDSLNPTYLILENTNRIQNDINRVIDIPYPGMIEGFLGAEGPYPELLLPKIVWMEADEAKICIWEDGIFKVNLEAMPSLDVTVEVIDSNLIPLLKEDFSANVFKNIKFDLELSKHNRCVKIIANGMKIKKKKNMLLFSRIKIEK